MCRSLALMLILAVPPAGQAENLKTSFDPVFAQYSFGAFCQVRTVGEKPAPDTASKKIDLIDGIPDIRWPGTYVPAVPGISFGIRTETRDGTVLEPVLIELTHPPFANSGITRQSYVTSLGSSDISINAYSFDEPEELVTGTWTFQAIYRGQTLYQVSFEVVPAAQLPQIAGGCEGYFGA